MKRRAAQTRSAQLALAVEKTGATGSSPAPVVLGTLCPLCVAYVGELFATAMRLLVR